MNSLTRRSLLLAGFSLLGSGALVACSPQANSTAPTASSSTNSAGTAITHVHAITRDAATGVILLATHEGLFRWESRQLTQVGPVVDLTSRLLRIDLRQGVDTYAAPDPVPGA